MAKDLFNSKLKTHWTYWKVGNVNAPRCPIPGNIQGQFGWGSEQPGLVEDVPAHCRRVGLGGL